MREGTGDSDLWRLTVQHSPIGMTLVTLDGRLSHVNDALCDMFGYRAEELRQRGFQELTHPDDLATDLAELQRLLDGEADSYRLLKRYLHADGHVVWGDLSVAVVRDPAGRPLHFVSQVLDVTAQQEHAERLARATAAIERERQTLETIFETVTVGLLLLGPDGTYERMNRRHAETMSLPFPDGHAGRAGQLGHVFHLDGTTPLGREEMPTYRASQGEEFDDYTYWVGADPLTRAAFSVSARQVRGPSGERLGAALAYQEITDLLRAVKVKDDFVSSVSHELRTPLTSVLGHLEMLAERDNLPDDAHERLRVVQRNAERLHTLVTDLLHVGELTSGTMVLDRRTVDLVGAVRDVVDAARPTADALGVSVVVEEPGGPLAILADDHRLRQVVENLLSNAVKYSGPGAEVRLLVGGEATTAVLHVRDSGMGIPADEVPYVFDRFFRGSRARDRQVQGTGLGLNIVAAIVAAHDGTIEVRSEVDVGTTVVVTLPLAEA